MTDGPFPNMPTPDPELEVVVLDDPDELVVIEVGRPELEGATVIAVDDLPPVEGGGSSGPLSYTHEQVAPSETWLILHPLPFDPSGIEVEGTDGQRLYPQRITRPALGRVRLDFPRPVSGRARLS